MIPVFYDDDFMFDASRCAIDSIIIDLNAAAASGPIVKTYAVRVWAVSLHEG